MSQQQSINPNNAEPLGGPNTGLGTDQGDSWAAVVAKLNAMLPQLYTGVHTGAVASLGTTQNSTPTAAQLLGGFVTQTGQTGAGTVTLPTGTLMSAAVSGVAVGDNFQCIFANLGGSENLVITAATGMAVVGNGTVPSGKNAILNFVNTGTNAWSCYVTVSA